MNPNLEVELTIRMPNGGKMLRRCMRLSEQQFDESFAPLPQDREIPTAVQARIKATKQKQIRRWIARAMAEELAITMLEMIEKEDPQHGYSPEEWRRINELNP